MTTKTTNHPNRGKGTASKTPTPVKIAKAREAAGLTQTGAAELVHSTDRAWRQWEAGDRRMHPAFFELFELKVLAMQRSA